MLRGIVQATDSTNVSHIYAVCSRHFGTLVALVQLYHTHPEQANLVLNLFGTIVGCQVRSCTRACVRLTRADPCPLRRFAFVCGHGVARGGRSPTSPWTSVHRSRAPPWTCSRHTPKGTSVRRSDPADRRKNSGHPIP